MDSLPVSSERQISESPAPSATGKPGRPKKKPTPVKDGQVRKSQRPSWSCTECTRRKIKCDKIVPGCNQCIRRGITQLCRLEVQDTQFPLRDPILKASQSNTPRMATTAEYDAICQSINTIRQRLFHLEAVVSNFVPHTDEFGTPSGMYVFHPRGRSGSETQETPAPEDGFETRDFTFRSGPGALNGALAGALKGTPADPFRPSQTDGALGGTPGDPFRPAPAPSGEPGLLAIPTSHSGLPNPPAPAADSDNEVEAAVTLEFLALGRDRKQDHFSRAELRRPESAEDTSPHVKAEAPSPDSPLKDPSIHATSPAHAPELADLLPTEELSEEIVAYSLRHVGWQHAAVHAFTFKRQCSEFFGWGAERGALVNQAWLALYFAMLCVGVKHATTEFLTSLGLSADAGRARAKAYFDASVAALHRGNFLAKHSIYSVQAIVILVGTCQDVGGSDLIATLLACAIRIAQHLNMHRFSSDADWLARRRARGIDPASPEARKALIDREVRKRLWCSLCIEDWVSIPYRRTYAIYPSHCRTPLPINCHDKDLEDGVYIDRPLSEPTVVTKIILTVRVASCVRRFFDDISLSGPSYALCLEIDRSIRGVIAAAPPYLQPEVPVETYPPFVAWMQHYWIMSVYHKLLIVHRVFLGRSFKDARFSYSRQSAIEAARAIIHQLVRGSHLPHQHIWTIPYHAVVAATTIMLDIFNSPSKADSANKRRDVEAALNELEVLASDSSIAARGYQLLSTLLSEEQKYKEEQKRLPRGGEPRSTESRKRKAAELETADANSAPTSVPLSAARSAPTPHTTNSALTSPDAFNEAISRVTATHTTPSDGTQQSPDLSSLPQDAFDSILMSGLGAAGLANLSGANNVISLGGAYEPTPAAPFTGYGYGSGLMLPVPTDAGTPGYGTPFPNETSNYDEPLGATSADIPVQVDFWRLLDTSFEPGANNNGGNNALFNGNEYQFDM